SAKHTSALAPVVNELASLEKEIQQMFAKVMWGSFESRLPAPSKGRSKGNRAGCRDGGGRGHFGEACGDRLGLRRRQAQAKGSLVTATHSAKASARLHPNELPKSFKATATVSSNKISLLTVVVNSKNNR
ncbi:unnamed protein product, partial [Polarella glacialis]